MKSRCLNSKNHAFKDYGGRGISVCVEWKNSFKSFYDDMIPTYKKGLQLDRIDNDGDYSRENCRWATRLENMNNRRVGGGTGYSRYITFNGKTENLAGWAKIYGISREAMRLRVNKHNSVELPTQTLDKKIK